MERTRLVREVGVEGIISFFPTDSLLAFEKRIGVRSFKNLDNQHAVYYTLHQFFDNTKLRYISRSETLFPIFQSILPRDIDIINFPGTIRVRIFHREHI